MDPNMMLLMVLFGWITEGYPEIFGIIKGESPHCESNGQDHI
jgi:hypothetical protein